MPKWSGYLIVVFLAPFFLFLLVVFASLVVTISIEQRRNPIRVLTEQWRLAKSKGRFGSHN